MPSVVSSWRCTWAYASLVDAWRASTSVSAGIGDSGVVSGRLGVAGARPHAMALSILEMRAASVSPPFPYSPLLVLLV
ncbi:hypothetical protein P692DRAFT_20842363 [Suillus brevipes Sb2]|nr:hypothetical protein P692DRAFT_20842363 [Suillus brevipes Sb2]